MCKLTIYNLIQTRLPLQNEVNSSIPRDRQQLNWDLKRRHSLCVKLTWLTNWQFPYCETSRPRWPDANFSQSASIDIHIFRRWEGSRWSPPPCLRATRAPGPSSCGSSCWSSSRTSPASSSSPGPGTAGSSNSRTRTRWSSVYISIYHTLPLWIRMNILAQQIRECAIYKFH